MKRCVISVTKFMSRIFKRIQQNLNKSLSNLNNNKETHKIIQNSTTINQNVYHHLEIKILPRDSALSKSRDNFSNLSWKRDLRMMIKNMKKT